MTTTVDKLFKELSKNSILLISMHGVRTVLERELGIDNLHIGMDETVKAEIDRDFSEHEGARYPYAYMSISELIGIRDQNNNKHAQRNGIRMAGQAGADGATRATSRKAYIFPINMGMDLKYLHDDPLQALIFAESCVILSMVGGLSFNIRLNEGLNFDVRIEIPESTSIPIATRDSTESPGGFEVTLSLVIHTYSGFFKDVSAVNSNHATIDMIIETEKETIKTEI